MSSIECFDLSQQVHTVQALSSSNVFPLTEKASYILLPMGVARGWAKGAMALPNF